MQGNNCPESSQFLTTWDSFMGYNVFPFTSMLTSNVHCGCKEVSATSRILLRSNKDWTYSGFCTCFSSETVYSQILPWVIFSFHSGFCSYATISMNFSNHPSLTTPLDSSIFYSTINIWRSKGTYFLIHCCALRT